MNQKRVVTMIHVPDVQATVAWYQNLGFSVDDTYGDDKGGLSFAILSFGNSSVMFNSGGRSSNEHRREVDLYIYVDGVDDIYSRLKDEVEVFEIPHDTFYGMRELIIRDLNRFWITFGQENTFSVLMNGIREGDAESVKEALQKGGLKPEALTAALSSVSSGEHENSVIVKILKDAGALAAPEVDGAVLRSYAGNYKDDQGHEITVSVEEGELFAAIASQQPIRLLPVGENTFRPAPFDGMTVTFQVEAGAATSFSFADSNHVTKFTRTQDA